MSSSIGPPLLSRLAWPNSPFKNPETAGRLEPIPPIPLKFVSSLEGAGPPAPLVNGPLPQHVSLLFTSLTNLEVLQALGIQIDAEAFQSYAPLQMQLKTNFVFCRLSFG